MWARFKKTWIWRHRTKNVGALGIVAGGVQNFLAQHDHVLPQHVQGLSLMALGSMAAIVGVYNSLKDYFGWQDEP